MLKVMLSGGKGDLAEYLPITANAWNLRIFRVFLKRKSLTSRAWPCMMENDFRFYQ